MNGKKIHIIGIGGTGMNGIAQLAAHAGYSVSGSDRACNQPNCIVGQASLYPESLCSLNDQDNTHSRILDSTSGREASLSRSNDRREWQPRPTTQPNDIFQTLEKMGIRIVPQNGSGITDDTDAVVYSTAIESDNPDIQKAKSLNIPLLHRADMLAKLCEGKEVIAVAGTAGKSTVTGLLGWIFQCLPAACECKRATRENDPTVYCGAPVLNWKNENTIGNVRFGTGPWIIEADESDKSFLKFHPQHAIITNIAEDHFSLAELHQLFAQFESQVSGVVIKHPSTLPPFHSPLLGKHNVENIRNALTLCQALGLDMHKCIEAVGGFKGIERRLERHGTKVIDDFAHSPVKIAAALEAVSGEFPAFSAYWRPHGYTPLAQGLEAFVECFSDFSRVHPACKFFILPVYFAGGTVNIKVTSEQLVERLNAAGVPAEFVEDFQTLERRLLEEGLPVLGMGARDPELPLFARQLAGKIY